MSLEKMLLGELYSHMKNNKMSILCCIKINSKLINELKNIIPKTIHSQKGKQVVKFLMLILKVSFELDTKHKNKNKWDYIKQKTSAQQEK